MSAATDVPDAGNEPELPSASQRIARNTAFRIVGEAFAKLGTLAVFVLLARELGATAFGQFTFSISLASLLVIGSGIGTDEVLAREVSRDPSRLVMLDDVLALKSALSLLVITAASVVLWIGGSATTSVEVFVLVGSGTLLDNLQRTWHSVFQAFERMQYISATLIVQRTVTAIGIALVLWLGGGVVAASAMFAGGSLVGVIVAEVLLRRRIGRPPRNVRPRGWTALVRISFPLGLITLLFTMLLRLDMSLLGVLAPDGSREVGMYGAAFRLFETTMFLTWSFAGAVLPWFARSAHGAPGELGEGLRLAMKALMAVLVPVAVVLAVFAEPIVHLLYTSAYDDAIVPLRALAVVTVCYGINVVFATLLISTDRPKAFIVIVTPIIVVNVALNVAFVPIYGATGAAWASAASGVMLVVAGAFQMRGIVGPVNWWRAVGGPGVAAGCMAGVGLFLPVASVPAAVAALVVYVLVLGGFELAFHRGDVDAGRAAIRRRGTPADDTDAPVRLGTAGGTNVQ